jgi:hypothetical protein
VSPPHLDVNLEAIRICLRNLEGTIASLLQFRLLLPEGPLRDRLIDGVSSLDSIADVMRQALLLRPHLLQTARMNNEGIKSWLSPL